MTEEVMGIGAACFCSRAGKQYPLKDHFQAFPGGAGMLHFGSFVAIATITSRFFLNSRR